jgi:protein-tyrosine phosphatase
LPEHDHRSRHLVWDGCLNVRDLGGLPTEDGGEIRPGAVVRSDGPNYLTESGCQALVGHGVRTIVDVRLPDEAAEASYQFMAEGDHGILYVNASLFNPDPATWPDLSDMPPLAEDYKGIVDRNQPQVAAIMRAIADAPEGGVLVHCAAGKDRTGIVVALLLDLAGVPHDLIAADYALSSANIESRTREWIESAPEERAEREAAILRGTTLPEVMLAVLAHLDARYGGAEGYLLAAGCTADHVARVRARLMG